MQKNKEDRMHSFLKYPGGKSKEVTLVLNNLPNYIERYIEPFVGGGSIFFAINKSSSYINDISTDLYYLYKLIKEQNVKLKKYLLSFDKYWHDLNEKKVEKISFSEDFLSTEKFNEFYAFSKKKKNITINKLESDGKKISDTDLIKIEITARKTAFYMLIRNVYNNKINNKVIRAACFYFLREYCYSSMFRFSSKGDFNVPYGGMSYNNKYLKSKIEYIFSNKMKEYLSNTIIENKDFARFLDDIELKEDDFIFLDPPYDSDFSTYDNNPFDKNEQIRLRDYLLSTPSKWMLIIKKTDFIYDLYKNFNIYEYNMNYVVSFKNRNDKDVKHLLITNYDLKREKKNG